MTMTSLASPFRLLALAGFVALAPFSWAQTDTTTDDALPPEKSQLLENPSSGATPAQVLAAADAEQQMLARVTQIAAGGDVKRAWKALTADVTKGGSHDGVSFDRLGWRIMSVAGFLCNMEDRQMASVFTQYALNDPWCRKGPTDEVRYWCARLSVEILGDRKSARQWVGNSHGGEPDHLKELRDRLDQAEREFPSNG